MKKNLIPFDRYAEHKRLYGHIATWAVWDEAIINSGGLSVDGEYELRNKLILAQTEEEYREKGLDKVLHGDVVILAYNFSRPKEAKTNTNKLISVLNKYDYDSEVLYKELVKLVEEDERYVFANMHKGAAKLYGPIFSKYSALSGAYMTDFLKFVEVNGELLPAGIPESKSSAKKLREEIKNNSHIHARGLKEEFDILGIKPKVIVLCSGEINSVAEKAISEALGYEPKFVRLTHYKPCGSVTLWVDDVAKKGPKYKNEQEAFMVKKGEPFVEEMREFIDFGEE